MPRTSSVIAERRQEFRDFVWNHAVDAFQAKFDLCASLTDEETAPLLALLSRRNLHDANKLAKSIGTQIPLHPGLLRKLLQIVGLTRNKVIQDIKAYARNNNLNISLSNPEALFRDRTGVTLGSEYLARQLIRVFSHTADNISVPLLEALNQATWPGYIRQERAKRMGHEAEYRLACLLRDCGLPFAPEAKAENPLCRDLQISGMSYDLVAPSAERALLRVVATIHTANIGQYGESKDDLEIRKALAAIKSEGLNGVVLLAFIDGVGFESNRAGLTGVLANAHEFCQFRTIWKAGVIAASLSKRRATVALPKAQHDRFSKFCGRYGAKLVSSNSFDDAPEGWTPAGDGFLRVNR